MNERDEAVELARMIAERHERFPDGRSAIARALLAEAAALAAEAAALATAQAECERLKGEVEKLKAAIATADKAEGDKPWAC